MQLLKVQTIQNKQLKIRVSVKFARADKIDRRYFYTKTLLHEWTKFHEDTLSQKVTFVRADNFPRRSLCTG